ncbi:TDT family transporter [Schnuerera sp. xch1]|uniref:TDT family transporter n=1 Tax=Schnuerera sp. xch1 TaxID=2874283 RepID=UPI001CBF33B0|nr:TDT family transporter [Schnuerera sp. xch1]MBZ2174045.1 TDT family transporter [Schnuerera sp. xch1]
MGKTIKRLPIPITGLMLALASLGNLVLSYGNIYRNIFGILSATLLVLIILKITKHPEVVAEELENPVVASTFPTLSMGIMLISTYIVQFSSSIACGVWVIGLVLHVILAIIFTIKYVFNFNIKKVFPSWFIVYVGIVVGSVTAPTFQLENIGKGLFWFGLITYTILIPIVIKRVLIVKEIPEPALPTLIIFAAPASLCLAGYLSSFQEKNMILFTILLVVSQFTYLLTLVQLTKLLKLKFYPSYAAFTFPLVISAISIKLANGFLTSSGISILFLNYVVKFEEILAIVIVLYVLVRYVQGNGRKVLLHI